MRQSLLLFLLLASLLCHAQSYNPDAFKQKVRILRIFLDKNHYSPRQWNDSASLMLYNKWIDLLDDDKVYFTKTEMDELETYKTKLDDEMNGASWGFFDKSIALFKKAARRSDSLRQLLYTKPADFIKPDAVLYPFDNYAATNAELQNRYSKLLKWRILHSIVSQLDTNENITAASLKIPADFAAREIKARQASKKRNEVKMKELPVNNEGYESEMADRYLQAISWCYDPHTMYMNLEEKKGFETELSGFEYSTGMGLEQNDDGDYEVGRLEPGGNAWRSGELHKGDVVLSIKKGNGPDRQLSEMDEREVDELMSGSSDEKVELTVKSASGVTRKITLTKEKVTNDEGIVKSYVIGKEKKIGYIKLPDFYSRELDEIKSDDDIKFDGCANDVSKEIVKLSRDTIAGLIIDLRYNGGGSMWEAMQLAGIFIDYGPVGSVKEKDGKAHFLKDPNRGTAYDGPLLVLVNGASASASELTSAMLQDYKRALIVGSTTYGKGTSQRVLPLDTAFTEETKKSYEGYKDFVKVTGGKFYRIDGSTTQWKGVVPDIALPDVFESLGLRESKSASALLPDNSKKGIYQQLTGIPVETLKEKSNKRVSSDSSFLKVKTTAALMNTYRGSKNIPLQWAAFTAEYAKNMEIYKRMEELEEGSKHNLAVANNNFDKEKIKFATASGKELNEGYLEIIAEDAYINEAYNIMLDWINK